MTRFSATLPMMLNATLDAVMPAYRELFARYQLTEQQWRILRVLWEDHSLPTAELSKRTLLPAPSLVGILDRLEKKGLVQRLRSDEDRRVVCVIPTEAGQALELEIRPQVAAIHEAITQRVTPQEWEALSQILSKIQAGSANQRPGEARRHSQEHTPIQTDQGPRVLATTK